jgi:hypothetical protein
MVFWSPPPCMVYRTPTHGILTPLPIVNQTMVYRTSYPCYIEHPTHGILTPYPWYIETPMHGISNPLPISWLEMREFNLPNRGIQFSIRGFNIPWGSKYHMTPGTLISRNFRFDIHLGNVEYTNPNIFSYKR